jgi:release factor glutamine methyltransferase
VAGEALDLTEAAIVARLRAAGCVFAEEEARLLKTAPAAPADLAAMVDRRVAGVPLEHVLGWAEFCGLRIAVDPAVFVPRRRTECLVREAVSLARQGSASQPVVVVDLCCGSGAVGAALGAALGDIELHAADIDPAAVACARRNLTAGSGAPPGCEQACPEPGYRAHVYQGDLYDPLPSGLRGRVRILTANVPYVPTQEVAMLPAEARAHEPLAAVDGGPDGLDVLRRVAAGARSWLAPGGHLLVETSDRQAPHAAEAFARAGLTVRIASCDDLGATVVIGDRALLRAPSPR